MIWLFFQNQLLGMKWLKVIVGKILTSLGFNICDKLGGSLHFFIYDVVKISFLLCTLIFAISYIQSYFPPEKSKQLISRFNGLTANCMAALLGTVTPFCSCSSIPLFIGFTSAGLPLGVTFSFLISSPMVDLSSLFLLISVFGLRIALIYVILGLIIAVIGGFVIEYMHMEKYVEDYIKDLVAVDGEHQIDVSQRDRLIFAKEQLVFTFKKVFPYIIIGVGIGAFIHNWIPETLVVAVLGNGNPLNVVLAVLVGIPMYADIFGTIPIAEVLLGKGAQLGTVIAFMMAITTLSLPSIVLLRKAVKPPLLLMFICICVVGIIIVGYFINAIQFLIV